jgi:transposase-like protein
MGRRLPRNRTGRRSRLTRERHDLIIELVAAGNHLTTAAEAVGIVQSTLFRWLQQGRDAAAARQNGESLTPEAVAYLEFSEALACARANAEVRAVAVVERVMSGGYLVSEEETIAKDGTRKVKRVYAPADGRLALEYLSRQSPERWGRHGVSRVELTGPDGGPAEVEESTVASALADRFTQVLAEREAEREQAALEAAARPG